MVIEGDDLVDEEKTEAIFKHVCQYLGMEFETGMLSWEPKKVNDCFPAFYEDINASTGIKKIESEMMEYPKEVMDAIESN